MVLVVVGTCTLPSRNKQGAIGDGLTIKPSLGLVLVCVAPSRFQNYVTGFTLFIALWKRVNYTVNSIYGSWLAENDSKLLLVLGSVFSLVLVFRKSCENCS